jgi:hypothetical protein
MSAAQLILLLLGLLQSSLVLLQYSLPILIQLGPSSTPSTFLILTCLDLK